MNNANSRTRLLIEIVVSAAAIISLIIFCSEATLWPLSRKLMLIFGAISLVAVGYLFAERKPPASSGYVVLMLILLSIGIILIGAAFQWFSGTNGPNIVEATFQTSAPTYTNSKETLSITPSPEPKPDVEPVISENDEPSTKSVDPEAINLFNQGKAYYDDESFDAAFPLLLEAAQYGYAEAEVHVGYCYFDGMGTKKDESKAVSWYARAAEHGSAKAQYVLGYCYFSGRGTSTNLDQAFLYFKKAADQNESKGLLWTGYCYQYGKGTDVNYKTALEYYKKARDSGNLDAQKRIDELLPSMQ